MFLRLFRAIQRITTSAESLADKFDTADRGFGEIIGEPVPTITVQPAAIEGPSEPETTEVATQPARKRTTKRVTKRKKKAGSRRRK